MNLKEISKIDWLDWNLRIDINRNKERSIQTSPFLIDGQYWIFMIDLGAREDEKNQGGPWFNFSVI